MNRPRVYKYNYTNIGAGAIILKEPYFSNFNTTILDLVGKTVGININETYKYYVNNSFHL